MTAEREHAYRLDELAERAEVSARTVRYYVQRGLLPAPVFRGRDTAYGEGHLLRLRAIKRLQERHVPLEEIAVVLARGDEAVRAVLSGEGHEQRARVEVGAEARHERHERHERNERNERNEGDETAGPRRPAAHGREMQPRRCARWRLAPGVELLVNDDIDEAGRALVDELIEHVRKRRTGGTE